MLSKRQSRLGGKEREREAKRERARERSSDKCTEALDTEAVSPAHMATPVLLSHTHLLPDTLPTTTTTAASVSTSPLPPRYMVVMKTHIGHLYLGFRV
jgi:hypothetical protein